VRPRDSVSFEAELESNTRIIVFPPRVPHIGACPASPASSYGENTGEASTVPGNTGGPSAVGGNTGGASAVGGNTGGASAAVGNTGVGPELVWARPIDPLSESWSVLGSPPVAVAVAVPILRAADDTFTPERHFPPSGQRGHSPQRHTAAPTTTGTGNTVRQRADPTQTAYAHPTRGAQAQGHAAAPSSNVPSTTSAASTSSTPAAAPFSSPSAASATSLAGLRGLGVDPTQEVGATPHGHQLWRRLSSELPTGEGAYL